MTSPNGSQGNFFTSLIGSGGVSVIVNQAIQTNATVRYAIDGVDLVTAASTIALTTEATVGSFAPAYARLIITASDTAVGVPVVTFGTNGPAYDNLCAGWTLTGLTDVDGFAVYTFGVIGASGISLMIPPETDVYFTVSSAAASGTLTCRVEIYGSYEGA